MIEDVLHSQELERQGHQEDIVGRIATLNDLKSVSQVDPPTVEELPKQRASEFAQIPQSAVPFFGHRVPVDLDALENFVPFSVAFAPGTQHRNLVPTFMQGQGLFPHPRVERNRQIFHDNQDFVFHGDGLFFL
jgi:hypothetical protein